MARRQPLNVGTLGNITEGVRLSREESAADGISSTSSSAASDSPGSDPLRKSDGVGKNLPMETWNDWRI